MGFTKKEAAKAALEEKATIEAEEAEEAPTGGDLPKAKVLAGPEADEGSMAHPEFEVVSSPEGGTPLLPTEGQSGLSGAWFSADDERRADWIKASDALEEYQKKMNIPDLGAAQGTNAPSERMMNALRAGEIKLKGGNEEVLRLSEAVLDAHKKWSSASEGVSTAQKAEREYKHKTAEQVDPSHVTETTVVSDE